MTIYYITSYEEFKAIDAMLLTSTDTVYLTDSFEIADLEFTPIVINGATIDGNSHTIFLNTTDITLFSMFNGGTIKNLIIDAMNLYPVVNGSYFFVATENLNGTFDNVHLQNPNIIADAAGFVYIPDGPIVFNRCSVLCGLNNAQSGSLFIHHAKNATFTNCKLDLPASTSYMTGGYIHSVESGSTVDFINCYSNIENCSAGTISGYIGNIDGNDILITFDKCIANISNSCHQSGFIDMLLGSGNNVTITNSYVIGTVNTDAGPIITNVGINCVLTINFSYHYTISAGTNGSVVNTLNGTLDMTSCYFDNDTHSKITGNNAVVTPINIIYIKSEIQGVTAINLLNNNMWSAGPEFNNVTELESLPTITNFISTLWAGYAHANDIPELTIGVSSPNIEIVPGDLLTSDYDYGNNLLIINTHQPYKFMNKGGKASSWSIDTGLPDNINFSTTTGLISVDINFPNTYSRDVDSYTITATNSANSSLLTVDIKFYTSNMLYLHLISSEILDIVFSDNIDDTTLPDLLADIPEYTHVAILMFIINLAIYKYTTIEVNSYIINNYINITPAIPARRKLRIINDDYIISNISNTVHVIITSGYEFFPAITSGRTILEFDMITNTNNTIWQSIPDNTAILAYYWLVSKNSKTPTRHELFSTKTIGGCKLYFAFGVIYVLSCKADLKVNYGSKIVQARANASRIASSETSKYLF